MSGARSRGLTKLAEHVRTNAVQQRQSADSPEVSVRCAHDVPSPRGARRSAPRHRPRTLFDICGEVELAILKTRAGSFFSSLSEPCRWLDWTFGAVITIAMFRVR